MGEDEGCGGGVAVSCGNFLVELKNHLGNAFDNNLLNLRDK
jgi:hypothetical protein